MAERLEEHKNHHLAFKRMPVADCPAKIPTRWIEALEHNQKIPSCCRHPETMTLFRSIQATPTRPRAFPTFTFSFARNGMTSARAA
jgi:hypothetical protein